MQQQKHELKASHLGKSFKSKWVVKDVSLSVQTGEIVGLLGPNGAGKTTSFYMIVGLIRANQGQVTLDQQDITKLPIHWRAQRGIGYLPQEASVFRKMTVEQNILAILETRSLNRSQRHDILESLLDEFSIQHIRQNKGISLSGGERRRVEIARCLAVNPRFVLLDEPFAGVDPISVIDIKEIIRHLSQRGIGVLITDHNVRETLDICQRAYIVNAGEIIATGSAEEVMNDQQVRQVYLGEQFSL